MIKMKKLAFLSSATVACLLSAIPAQAAQINLEGQTFEVSTIFSSFLESQSLLEEQPWFGDSAAAAEAASQVEDSLGLPNIILSGENGPLFVFDYDPSRIGDPALGEVDNVDAWAFTELTDPVRATFNFVGVDFNENGVFDAPLNENDDVNFAIAIPVESESVPEPAMIFGSLMMLGLGVVTKRKTVSSHK